MAEMVLQVVVSPLLGVLFGDLSSLIRKEIGLQWGVDKEMRRLANTLSTIKDVLEDAEENQLTNKAIVNWLQKLKDVALDAEDLLDGWEIEAMEMEPRVGNMARTSQVCNTFLSCFSFEQNTFRRKTAKNINELMERFEKIATERLNFHLRKEDVERRVELYPNRETSSFVTETQIYGRDDEKKYILEVLLNNVNTLGDPSVLPIVGMGGLGKTTLAQWVYNDEKVKEHFEVRAWVCVSDDFDVKRLTKEILGSVARGASGGTELDSLQRTLHDTLAGKRFLLVLDDVWNEEEDYWRRLQCSLKGGAKGSSVVVTTRLQKVASVMGTCPHHSLELLSEDDCWSLFKQRAFGDGKEGISSLVNIGKEIVQKCGGVPLAAKVLGGLMSSKVTERQWMLVRDSEIWTLEESGKNGILPALRLSYTHLSPVLRQCFAYCSMFPKDYLMEKQEVVELWMANGLIPSSEGLHEEVGNENFDALVHTSFFQVGKEDWHGGMMFTMHDLVHDLACSITVRECVCVDDRNQVTKIQEGIRHLSILGSQETINPSIHKLAPKVRTFLEQNHYCSDFNFSSFAFIRALSFKNCELITVGDSLGDLKHLRYLCFSSSAIMLLPESICQLRKLQTLRLRHCYNLQKLPEGLKKILSLRHLDISDCFELREMPVGMGKLTCLRTLSNFKVGRDDGRHIKELKELDHLGGEIKIEKLEYVTNVSDAKEANLMRKQNLEHLQLIWSDSHLEDENDKDVLEALQPHSNIKILDIERYQGITYPSWMGLVETNLPNLVEIRLYHWVTCQQLPSFGKLPLLKRLHLYLLRSVKFFEVHGFPSLETLTLSEMDALEEWSSSSSSLVARDEQVVLFPCLKLLEIAKCPQLKRLSSLEDKQVILLPSLKEIKITECPILEGLLFPTSLQGSPQTHFPLKKLSISACPAMDFSSMKFQLFVALEELEIMDFTNMASLPDGIQHLSSTLVTLRLHSLRPLVVLPDWIGSLTSLRNIYLRYLCVKELPEGLKHLSNLHTLSLYRCHVLRERCTKQTGADWHKIAHIPDFR